MFHKDRQSFACLLLSLFWLGGCATEEVVKFSIPEDHYQPVLDRQKAGLDPSGNALVDLPEKTVEEYEKLGDSYLERDHPALAIVEYQKGLQLDPSRVTIRYKIGTLLLKVGKAKEARDQFEKILEYDVMFAPAYLGMGQALLQMGEDIGADQQFRRALTFDPKMWRAHNYLGILADRRHLHLSAIEAYKAALAIEPNEAAVLNNLGMAYFLNAQYSDAARAFLLALQADGHETKIANNLGLALAKLKRYSEAYDAFRRGTNDAMAYNNVGIALLESGKPLQAIACFEKAIELEPTFYEKANQNLVYARRVLAADGPSHLPSPSPHVTCF